jgi:hypothetical protein
MDDETLIELWSRLKPFLNKNEMSAVADAVVTTLDDAGLLEISEQAVIAFEDHILKDAIIDHFEFEFEDEDEEYE